MYHVFRSLPSSREPGTNTWTYLPQVRADKQTKPTTYRRSDDPEYRDDPEFSRFSETLSEQLFSLTSKIGRLSQQLNLLGTKRDTERVRERVHDLLEEARDGFKEVGEGVKKLTTWEDLSVWC